VPSFENPKIVAAGEDHFVQIEGVIDESFDSSALLVRKLKEPVIDLDLVTRVTSAGVRKWVMTAPKLEPFWLINCRPAVVSALNIVSRFAAGGHVVSLYAPYLCASCRESFDLFIDRRTAPPEAFGADADCPACGKKAFFDEIQSEYFAFVRAHPLAHLPVRVARIVDLVGRVTLGGPGERLRDARVRAADAQERAQKVLDRTSVRPRS
jgi:hypothetical protein